MDSPADSPSSRCTASQRPGRRLVPFLVILTTVNLSILGVMIWLFQRVAPDGEERNTPAGDTGARRDANSGRSSGRLAGKTYPTRRRENTGPAAATTPTAPTDASKPAPAAGSRPTPELQGILAGIIKEETVPGYLPFELAPGQKARMEIAGVPVDFCWIGPEGFVMGSPATESQRAENEPRHDVLITKGFWLARTECTVDLWTAVMNNKRTAGAEEPVVNVSWNDIAGSGENFLTRLTTLKKLPEGWQFSLPTEAQWEFACRAGTVSPFSFGAIMDGSQANCNARKPYGTSGAGMFVGGVTKVASYPPNRWGLCDMHGNVLEWCQDSYESSPSGISDLVSAKGGTSRVVRGGSWRSLPGRCRSAARQAANAASRDEVTGFRPAIVRIR